MSVLGVEAGLTRAEVEALPMADVMRMLAYVNDRKPF